MAGGRTGIAYTIDPAHEDEVRAYLGMRLYGLSSRLRTSLTARL
jgi:cation transport regulator ChaC